MAHLQQHDTAVYRYQNLPTSTIENVQDNLRCFSKINALLNDLLHKSNHIYDEAAHDMLSTADTYLKKLNDINKDRGCKNESFTQFLHDIINEVKNHGKLLQALSVTLRDGIINPMQQERKRAKKTWKSCFHYVQTFKGNIRKREEELAKCQKEYSDAVTKGKTSDEPKVQSFIGNSHNTHLLQSVSVDIANKMLCTSVLPTMMHTIETNQQDYQNKLKQHLKRYYNLQKETNTKISKLFETSHKTVESLELVTDLQQFIDNQYDNSNTKTERLSKFGHSIRKSFHIQRTITLCEPSKESLTVNEWTTPNLKRSLEILKQERSDIIEEKEHIKSLSLNNNHQKALRHVCSTDLNYLFSKCDNEVHLKIIDKQLACFTSHVVSGLDETEHIPLNKSTSFSRSLPELRMNGINSISSQKAHKYTEARLVKPQVCFYCNKWLTMVTKGLNCSVCKITVHKRCVMNVPFCEADVNLDDARASMKRTKKATMSSKKISPMFSKKWERYVAPESPETEVCSYYVEFTGGVVNEKANIYHQQAHHLSNEPEYEKYTPKPRSNTLPECKSPSLLKEEWENDEGSLQTTRKHTSSSSLNNMYLPTPDDEYDTDTSIYLCPVDAGLPEIQEEEIVPVTSPIYEKIWSSERRGDDNIDDAKDTLNVDNSQIRRHSMPEFFTFPQMAKQQEEQVNPDSPLRTLDHIYTKPNVREEVSFRVPNLPKKNDKHIALYGIGDNGVGPTPLSPTPYEVMLPPSPIRKAYINKTSPPVLPTPLAFVDPKGKSRLTRRRSSSLNNVLENRTRLCVALYNYQADNRSEISFTAGVKIEVFEKFNHDWWRGKLYDAFGFFPSKYVFEISPSDVILKVVLDYDKQRDRELSVSTGQILVMTKKEGNWLQVRCPDGEGYVPVSYVELVERAYMKISTSSSSWRNN